MNMTDKEFVAQVERYYCKQQRSQWQAFVIGCVLLAVTVMGHDWLSHISDELPTLFSLISGLSFSVFLVNYWGTPADKLLGEAVQLLEKYRHQRR
ncbi:hypothetical protein JYB87_14560 [Shewanella avicenniae]|uniref:Holin n=1 Tax=Shewanella avicenniae TaxID=2814294 RepID=A0ABX7QPT8_9GAMM|nr:hypothetical protein [Shewanella avicenniae]QSX32951.1 hypothetical protein JYB87_14560 [Shewanella avicenniae]